MEDWLRQEIKSLKQRMDDIGGNHPDFDGLKTKHDAYKDALLEALSRKLIDLEAHIAMMEPDPSEFDDDDEDGWFI